MLDGNHAGWSPVGLRVVSGRSPVGLQVLTAVALGGSGALRAVWATGGLPGNAPFTKQFNVPDKTFSMVQHGSHSTQLYREKVALPPQGKP